MDSSVLQNKKINPEKLLKYGFRKEKSKYVYSKPILDGDFVVNFVVVNDEIKTEVTEKDTNEQYMLHLIDGGSGSFVGQVRSEYENILNDIIENCCDVDVFKFEYSKKVLEYAYKKYGSKAEYLWEKFPRNAVCRRCDNKKWYFAVLSVSKDKFGFESKEIVEVIDLRVPSENMSELLKESNIYPAYHMNKKHWISIILDGSMELDKIFEYIDRSYLLAKKK